MCYLSQLRSWRSDFSVVKSLTAFVGGEGGKGGVRGKGTRKTEGVILGRKKANTACGSDMYINR